MNISLGKAFGQRIYAGYYYLFLVYEDLAYGQQTSLRYWKHISGMKMEGSQMSENVLHEQRVHRDNVEHSVRIVEEALCSMHYITGSWYLLRDDILKMELIPGVWIRNGDYYQIRSWDGAPDFQSHHSLGSLALCSINVVGECYWNYYSYCM